MITSGSVFLTALAHAARASFLPSLRGKAAQKRHHCGSSSLPGVGPVRLGREAVEVYPFSLLPAPCSGARVSGGLWRLSGDSPEDCERGSPSLVSGVHPSASGPG